MSPCKDLKPPHRYSSVASIVWRLFEPPFHQKVFALPLSMKQPTDYYVKLGPLLSPAEYPEEVRHVAEALGAELSDEEEVAREAFFGLLGVMAAAEKHQFIVIIDNVWAWREAIKALYEDWVDRGEKPGNGMLSWAAVLLGDGSSESQMKLLDGLCNRTGWQDGSTPWPPPNVKLYLPEHGPANGLWR